MVAETETIRNGSIAFVLLLVLGHTYYYVQFGEWLKQVTRTLTLVNLRPGQRIVQMDYRSHDGKYIIEVMFATSPEDGYFARFEVNNNPILFTNELILSYWLVFLIRQRISVVGKVKIITFVVYRYPHDSLSGYRTDVEQLQLP